VRARKDNKKEKHLTKDRTKRKKRPTRKREGKFGKELLFDYSRAS
jgi:hypothetical protein